MSPTTTPLGYRIYQIRVALAGDGARYPVSQREFAERLSALGEGPRHASYISKWETGAMLPTLDDIRLMAALDPRERGRAWLAWGTPPDATR